MSDDWDRVRAKMWLLLNDPDNHEYEGLGRSVEAELREMFDIEEPQGAWLARPMDEPPEWVRRGIGETS